MSWRGSREHEPDSQSGSLDDESEDYIDLELPRAEKVPLRRQSPDLWHAPSINVIRQNITPRAFAPGRDGGPSQGSSERSLRSYIVGTPGAVANILILPGNICTGGTGCQITTA